MDTPSESVGEDPSPSWSPGLWLETGPCFSPPPTPSGGLCDFQAWPPKRSENLQKVTEPCAHRAHLGSGDFHPVFSGHLICLICRNGLSNLLKPWDSSLFPWKPPHFFCFAIKFQHPTNTSFLDLTRVGVALSELHWHSRPPVGTERWGAHEGSTLSLCFVSAAGTPGAPLQPEWDESPGTGA